MTTTITGKLNKSAHQFQAGDSTGFGLRLGVQYYDRETKDKQWTNYECAIFSKNPNQIAFLQNNLVEGSIVEVSGQQEKIKTFEGQNGQSISIELLDAKIGYIHSPQQTQPAYQQPQQQSYQQPQPAPQQQQATSGYQQQPQQQMPPQGAYDPNTPPF
jgi:hypothetical protein